MVYIVIIRQFIKCNSENIVHLKNYQLSLAIANSVPCGEDIDEVNIKKYFNTVYDENSFHHLSTVSRRNCFNIIRDWNKSDEEWDDGREERFIQMKIAH